MSKLQSVRVKAHWSPVSGRRLRVTAALSVLALHLTGCAIIMASQQPPHKNLEVLKEGTHRSVVRAELGRPVTATLHEGKRVEVFSFVQGPSDTVKNSRVLAHGVADWATLGLWEVVGAPTEALLSGTPVVIEVTYDGNDAVEKVEAPSARVQISDLMVTYAHADSAFVDALAVTLQERGIRFWREAREIPAGSDLEGERVDRRKIVNPTLVLILSESSVGSNWVKDDVERARDIEKDSGRAVLVPVCIDNGCTKRAQSRRLNLHNVLTVRGLSDTATINQLIDRLAIFYTPKKRPEDAHAAVQTD